MMTTIYFIRHCEPNYDNHDDMTRELSEKGLQDCQLLVDFFTDKTVNIIFSSPYKRAFDSIQPLAKKLALDIHIIDDFRERKIDSTWIENFTEFSKKQWSDFSYKLTDGESLQEVQDRNVAALNNLLQSHPGKALVVGSHGTAISTIISHFNKNFGYQDFNKIKSLMPFIAEFKFSNSNCHSIIFHNIFTGDCHEIYSI